MFTALYLISATYLHAEPAKKINFNPRPKIQSPDSVRDISVSGRVCLINEQRFQIDNDSDEQTCSAKGGRVQLTSGQTSGLPNVKDAVTKDASFYDRTNKVMPPPPKTQGFDYDKKVRGNIHYDPLEANSP